MGYRRTATSEIGVLFAGERLKETYLHQQAHRLLSVARRVSSKLALSTDAHDLTRRRFAYCSIAVFPELYDLLADPYELENLVGLEWHREVKKVMRRRLVRRMVEAGEWQPEIEAMTERKARFHQEG